MIVKLIYCIFAYLMGNILGGKAVCRIYKEDFSKKGSFNIGARNAGRILGPKAFLFVATLDVFKGFFVIIILKLLNVDIRVIALCAFLVVLGHIKPIIFSFKGGKGVATFVGVVIALSPNLIFILILGFLLISFLLRSTILGFYSTIPILSFIFYLDTRSYVATLLFLILIIMMFCVGYKDIEKSFCKYFLIKRI